MNFSTESCCALHFEFWNRAVEMPFLTSIVYHT